MGLTRIWRNQYWPFNNYKDESFDKIGSPVNGSSVSYIFKKYLTERARRQQEPMTFVVTTSRKLHTANNYRVKLLNGDSVETM
jgi:hypothetical protein